MAEALKLDYCLAVYKLQETQFCLVLTTLSMYKNEQINLSDQNFSLCFFVFFVNDCWANFLRNCYVYMQKAC